MMTLKKWEKERVSLIKTFNNLRIRQSNRKTFKAQGY